MAVALVDCAGQKYPALQGPEHSALVSPCPAPNFPAGHGAAVVLVLAGGQKKPELQVPEHCAVSMPVVPPKRPAGQAF